MKPPSVPPFDENVPPTVPRVPPAVKARVIALHIAGESNRQIAKKLKMSKDTVPRIIAEGNIGSAAKNPSVERALALAGITPESLASHAAQGLRATETKLATWEGKFTDERQVNDNTTQHKYWQDLAKIAGMFPREDAPATAQLFVRLPDVVLTPGHGKTCACPSCCQAWESLPCETGEPNKSE